MVWVYGNPDEEYGYRQSLIFVLLLLPVLAGTTYLLLNFLVPRYLLKRRFFLFGLYSCYAVILAAWLELMIAMGLFVLVYEFQIELLNPKITDLGYLTGSMFLVILPAVAIQITRQWYRERELNNRLKQEKLELELYAREKELAYLKEQIRPHFLFNVLNNLYGLTLEKSDEAPELVLKVSDMLEYMLYHSSGDRVPLREEIEHISNYIEIQKIRCGDRLDLQMELDPSHKFYRVPPMILLPLVENSFKHGVSKASSKSYIHISIATRSEMLDFTITNSLGPANQTKESPGVGLQNIEKRLDILFGDRYLFKREKTEHEFRVELSIPITQIPHEEMEMYDS
ncbi:histidine kinase [Aliifodinibius sp. S!AR15-10]|uniref:sensor histidine kinase n=1 Tax=Aliifodinibius sp. S!AR15-10 TaxID=2950437 RepID=UPI002864BA00|nr:histidine kinase [Aliifodinibius sp. S!AR15-10]MDR8392445.1 histidine kinase [Aliifodinibius sp. S!AR15-10]